MSGGAFDYAYTDAEQLGNTVSEIREHAEEHGYPEAAIEELETLEETVKEGRDLLKTVEWVASGDYGRDALQEYDG